MKQMPFVQGTIWPPAWSECGYSSCNYSVLFPKQTLRLRKRKAAGIHTTIPWETKQKPLQRYSQVWYLKWISWVHFLGVNLVGLLSLLPGKEVPSSTVSEISTCNNKDYEGVKFEEIVDSWIKEVIIYNLSHCMATENYDWIMCFIQNHSPYHLSWNISPSSF